MGSWYVAVIIGPKLEKVRRSLLGLAAGDLGSVYCPMLLDIGWDAARPLFPGYVFVSVERLTVDLWVSLLAVDGVRRLLGNVDRPLAVAPAEMERLMEWVGPDGVKRILPEVYDERVERVRRGWGVGDTVEVTHGVWVGQRGRVLEVKPEKKLAQVYLRALLGRGAALSLSTEWCKRVPDSGPDPERAFRGDSPFKRHGRGRSRRHL